MSHTATVDVEFKDLGSLKKAVEDMGGSIEVAEKGKKLTKKFYSSTEQGDIAIQLPGWKYPVVINDGKASYDNYNGSWGKQSTFDKMKQKYSTAVATKKARRMGYTVKETAKADGTVRLTLSR